MNLVNARYGQEPGLKAYTHVSDQYGPFATQLIPATVNEAPDILDGLFMNETGRRIREQYADTGGFTDLVFAATVLLGYRFIPRIRDLPSKRLHVFEPKAVPAGLKGLIGDRIRENTVSDNWTVVLRSVATMAAGMMPPSQLLRKFASYSRQHDLAVALREIGRVERTLFIIDWLLDTDMQRRAQSWPEQGRGASCREERPADRPPGRNPGSDKRGPALPDCRIEPPHCSHHLLEHRPARTRSPETQTRRHQDAGEPAQTHLAAWMGPHTGHRRNTDGPESRLHRPGHRFCRVERSSLVLFMGVCPYISG